jgi:4-amino-4-deoxy-L-arabinose transferase-like glycosyltransferase
VQASVNSVISRISSWGPARLSLILIGLSVLLHLVVMGGIGLSGDEAHYALYGYHPALSYFDHPPMVGWLQAVIEWFSSSDFALRIWPLVFSAATAWALFRLSQELFPAHSRWTGFWAVVLMQSGLIFHVLALGMVPESPLMLFALLAFGAGLRALEGNRWRDWLLVGLWLGLAGLSKYTAITLVVTLLLLIAMERKWYLFGSPRLWVSVLLAAVIVSPVFYWNATHDWISFSYQLHHGTGASQWQLSHFLQSQAGQLISNGPALYLFGLIGLVTALRQRHLSGMRYSLTLALPVLLLFGWNGGYVVTLPHWTALGWLALSPAAAVWLIQVWDARRSVRWFAYVSALYSVILILPVFYLQLLHPWLPFEAGKDYLTGEFYGWPKAAQRASELRDEINQTPGKEARIFIGSWTLASRLAWYGRPEPVMVTDRRYDQFDLWFGSPKAGDRGVFVEWSVFPFPPRSSARGEYFDSCSKIETQDVMIGSRLGAQFSFYDCRGYRP